MRISNFKTDRKKETEGVWVEAGEGLRLLIARHNNVLYKRMIQKLGRSHIRLISSGQNPELVEEMTKKATAYTILLGWENLQDDDGKDIEYSKSRALDLLLDLDDFFDMVVGFATDIELFREAGFEERSGNLEESSDGN